MLLGKASRFAYLSGSAMAVLGLFAIFVVATWPSPVGPRVVITIALALLVLAELAMLPVGLRLYANLPAGSRPLGALGLLALVVSLAALLVIVWAYLAESAPPSPRLLEWALGGGAGAWMLLSNLLARVAGDIRGALPWIGFAAGAIWLLLPLNGFHMIAETTSVLGFLLYAAWATRLARTHAAAR